MAGMLAGVECARRRRFHQSGLVSDSHTLTPSQGWSRKPSFCLYTSNLEKPTSTSLMQRCMGSQKAYQDDEKLGVEAREAKGRLDERLRSQTKSLPKRNNGNWREGSVKGEKKKKEVQNDSGAAKKSGGPGRGLMRWARLSWHSSDQEECTICLEVFREKQSLMSLPCAHRFHSACLLPWLQANAYCPCCRMPITSSSSRH